MPGDRAPKPANPKSTVSVGLLLVALAVYFLAQWGGLGVFNGAPPSAPAATGIIAGGPVAAEVTAASTPKPTVAPTATRKARATSTPAADANAPPAATVEPKATATPTPKATANPTANPTATPKPAVTRASNLPTIAYDDLPPEAHDAITLIDQGGPFPFSRDGVTFQNRERILPRKADGYYHEYTVITPGEDDRGARRIVTGEDGEMYYTDDHYDSFREISFEEDR